MTTKLYVQKSSAGGVPAPPAGASAWLRLAVGAALFALFLAAFSQVSRHVPLMRNWGDSVDAYGLRPAAIYYTDYEASADAEALIRSSLEYPPQARK